MKIIGRFWGRYRFLSNFFPCLVLFEGIVYLSSEHAYQAAKTDDPEIKEKISKSSSPVQAKAAGYKIKLRAGWENIKLYKMYEICRAKFEQNEYLLKQLLETAQDKLIEGNTWHDNYWGDCICEKCENIPGQNYLGKILMLVRKELEGLQIKQA